MTAEAYSERSTSTSFDGKRHPRLKETQFIYKHGRRHHSFGEKAPYPLSYDRHVLDMESLDNSLTVHLRGGSVSYVNIKAPLKRTLDLGCGTGTWIIEAAKEWPDCEFVGFDLVNIQIPLKLLDPSVACRISWKHGNFLTTKLPFEDDEFDHVHIQAIAKGVPENKWGTLFEEINRILRPGGSVEIIEDDVVFPILPRWFTTALRSRSRREASIHLPSGSMREYPRPSRTPPKHAIPVHDHALLESLITSVFEHRFINMKPTAVLPSYFTTYFRQVTLGPVVQFPMPPLAPPLPLPSQITRTYGFELEPTNEFAETRPSSMTLSGSTSFTRPTSLSFSSTMSSSALSTAPLSQETLFNSADHSESVSSSLFPALEPLEIPSLSAQTSAENESSGLISIAPLKLFMLDSSQNESEISAFPKQLFPLEQLEKLTERSLAMHLYRSYQSVLACQEAMWEELKDRIRNRKEELVAFGWDDDEELEELQSRTKFETLVERYQKDMKARVSVWCSLTDLGWPLPVREPLSKAERIEEERIRESMLEARRHVSMEDLAMPCRSLRVLVGYKL